MYTGHALVKVFGRQQRRARRPSPWRTSRCTRPSFKAQFISGLIQPAMMFVSNLNYVVIAVVGGLRVASGAISIGDVQAFIQYSRQFTQPITQVASMMNLLQSGVASAERVFELLDEDEQSPEPAEPARVPQVARPGGVRGRVLPLPARHPADRRPVDRGRAGPDGRDRRPDRCGQDHAGQPHHAVLRGRLRPDHPGRRRHPRDGPRGPALPHRHGAAGHLAVRRDDRGQHRLRQGRGHPGGGRGGGAHRVRRPVRPPPARRVRHRHRRGGLERLAPARSSSSRSRGRSWPTRPSSSWTRRRARWTPGPRCWSRRR